MEVYPPVMSRKEMEEAIEEKDYKINDLKLDLGFKDVEIVRREIIIMHIKDLLERLDINNPVRTEALEYIEEKIPRFVYIEKAKAKYESSKKPV